MIIFIDSGGGGGVPAFVSSQATALPSSGTAISVSMPAGAQSGDLLLLFLTNGNSTRTVTPPSGLVNVLTDIGASIGLRLYTYACTGSDPVSWPFSFNAGTAASLVALLYRPGVSVPIVGARSFNTTTPTPSITTTEASVLVAYFCRVSTGATVTTPPSGMALRATAAGSANSVAVYDQTVAAGPTGTRSATFSTNGPGGSYLVAVT